MINPIKAIYRIDSFLTIEHYLQTNEVFLVDSEAQEIALGDFEETKQVIDILNEIITSDKNDKPNT